VLVPGRLSQVLGVKGVGIQERFRDRLIVAPGGIAFAGSEFVFAGYSGEPLDRTQPATGENFQPSIQPAAPEQRAERLGWEITAHGLRHSAATTSSSTWERICGNPGTALVEEYPQHRALHPSRL
jgi:hypothetical protein